MKARRIVNGIMAVLLSLVLVAIGAYSYWFYHLDVYTVDEAGKTVVGSSALYRYNQTVTDEYVRGVTRQEKVIGRVEGDSIFGRQIVKLAGYDPAEVVGMKGLMLKAGFKKY